MDGKIRWENPMVAAVVAPHCLVCSLFFESSDMCPASSSKAATASISATDAISWRETSRIRPSCGPEEKKKILREQKQNTNMANTINKVERYEVYYRGSLVAKYKRIAWAEKYVTDIARRLGENKMYFLIKYIYKK